MLLAMKFLIPDRKVIFTYGFLKDDADKQFINVLIYAIIIFCQNSDFDSIFFFFIFV